MIVWAEKERPRLLQYLFWKPPSNLWQQVFIAHGEGIFQMAPFPPVQLMGEHRISFPATCCTSRPLAGFIYPSDFRGCSCGVGRRPVDNWQPTFLTKPIRSTRSLGSSQRASNHTSVSTESSSTNMASEWPIEPPTKRSSPSVWGISTKSSTSRRLGSWWLWTFFWQWPWRCFSKPQGTQALIDAFVHHTGVRVPRNTTFTNPEDISVVSAYTASIESLCHS